MTSLIRILIEARILQQIKSQVGVKMQILPFQGSKGNVKLSLHTKPIPVKPLLGLYLNI